MCIIDGIFLELTKTSVRVLTILEDGLPAWFSWRGRYRDSALNDLYTVITTTSSYHSIGEHSQLCDTLGASTCVQFFTTTIKPTCYPVPMLIQ